MIQFTVLVFVAKPQTIIFMFESQRLAKSKQFYKH